MFNYNDIEDELDDRRPVFENGLYGDAPAPIPQPPTVLKAEERVLPAKPSAAKKIMPPRFGTKYQTQGTQLSLFDAAERQ